MACGCRKSTAQQLAKAAERQAAREAVRAARQALKTPPPKQEEPVEVPAE